MIVCSFQQSYERGHWNHAVSFIRHANGKTMMILDPNHAAEQKYYHYPTLIGGVYLPVNSISPKLMVKDTHKVRLYAIVEEHRSMKYGTAQTLRTRMVNAMMGLENEVFKQRMQERAMNLNEKKSGKKIKRKKGLYD